MPGEFDLVVVDGRARVACLQHAAKRLAPGGIVLFDDTQRPRYRAGLEGSGLQVQRILRAHKRGEISFATPMGRDPMALLNRALERLNRLVSDLLDVSRIKAGKLEMHIDLVDLSQVVRDVTAQMREEFANANCTLEMSLDEPLTGAWDRARLEQVVANLATNAVKYAAGKPVEITARSEDGTAVLRVKDQGMGIAPAPLDPQATTVPLNFKAIE